ncbi:MAG: hypothetical protein KatS3mg108_2287 [Isosphaeraceae bacterium]|jgi:hypothetical protein|nr:MAG: hypothetical protein KatS3mg108_2287 [Isosphaeraceae bacterium]
MNRETAPLMPALALILGIATLNHAQEMPTPTTYADHVAPIFAAKCNACHNNDKKKGGLVLDAYPAVMQGGASGAVVEPGDPDNSRLFLLVAHQEEPAMPPMAPKLPDAEIETIRRWIELGAPETSGSSVAVKAKPKMEFRLDPSAIGKPAGEPAMPGPLPTEPVVTSSRPPAVRGLAHSPWAPLAAIGGHRQVLLYHTQSQRLLGVLPFPEGNVEVLRFTPDGDLLLAGGGRGGQSGRVVVWDVKTGQRLFEVGKEYDTVLAADISPDRSLIALGGPGKVLRVYQTTDGELAYECKKHTDWVTAIAFSPDGVLLASGDRNGGLVVWEALTGREFYDLRGHSAMVTDVAWRPDSNVLASASEDASVRLWEMQNGSAVKNWGAHGGGVESVRFAKDGRIVTAGRDRLIKLWNGDGGAIRQLDAFPDIALRAVFNHDDSAIVSTDFSGEVRLNSAADGALLGTLNANPPPLAVRLEQARQQAAAAQAAAQAAAAELAGLQAEVDRLSQAVMAAQQALEAATQAKTAAEQAVANKVPEVNAARARAEQAQAAADALAAEQARQDAAAHAAR